MDRDRAVERLYDLKGSINSLPTFKGRAGFLRSIRDMIRFLNSHVDDKDLNAKFVNQGESLLVQAHDIVCGESSQQEQAAIF